MKRYLLFAGNDYYPSGGWHDLKASFDDRPTDDQIVQLTREYDWWDLVDLIEFRVVADCQRFTG